MPNVNPRTNLTLKPELHDLIQETADHLGLKRAQLITNLLEEFAPQLENVCCISGNQREKLDSSVVVSAFGADIMAEITSSYCTVSSGIGSDAKREK